MLLSQFHKLHIRTYALGGARRRACSLKFTFCQQFPPLRTDWHIDHTERQTERISHISKGTHHTPTDRSPSASRWYKFVTLLAPAPYWEELGHQPLHTFSHLSALSLPVPRKRHTMPLPPSKMRSTPSRTPFTPSLSLTPSGPIAPCPHTFRRYTPADAVACAAAAAEAHRAAAAADAAVTSVAAAPQAAPRVFRRRSGPPPPLPIAVPVVKVEKVVRDRVSTPRPPVAIVVTAAPANRRMRSCGFEGTGGFIRGPARRGA